MFCTWIALVSLHLVYRTSGLEEPICASKFDYDYKILNKLIDLERETESLKRRLHEQNNVLQILNNERKNQGSVYTAWGKAKCPGNDSSLVYSGIMAGSHHKNPGSGTNYICLTFEPIWGHYKENSESGGRIYGVEYQFSEGRSTGSIDYFGRHVYNKNAPCAVCHITRGSSVMIPGRKECYSGWTKEYSGYLVSASYNQKPTQYVCLVDNADMPPGSELDDDEIILYLVEGRCGKGLPCPPHEDKREITCVVCSL